MKPRDMSALEPELRRYCSLDLSFLDGVCNEANELKELCGVARSCYEKIVDASNYFLDKKPFDVGDNLDTLIQKVNNFEECRDEYIPLFEEVYPPYSESNSFNPERLAQLNKVFIASNDINLRLNLFVLSHQSGDISEDWVKFAREFCKRTSEVDSLEEFRILTYNLHPGIFLEEPQL